MFCNVSEPQTYKLLLLTVERLCVPLPRLKQVLKLRTELSIILTVLFRKVSRENRDDKTSFIDAVSMVVVSSAQPRRTPESDQRWYREGRRRVATLATA